MRRPRIEEDERAATWHTLDLARPAYGLRCAALGLAPVTDPARAAALGVDVGAHAPVLTLPEAAALLGVTVSTVHQPERRELRGALPTLATLLRLADAFGLDVEVRVRRRAP